MKAHSPSSYVADKNVLLEHNRVRKYFDKYLKLISATFIRKMFRIKVSEINEVYMLICVQFFYN
jgi:hypothetical protein